MAESILFIYGTLKRGHPANGLLRGATFLGEARTGPGYRLYDLGPYPGLVEDPEGRFAVRGELWEVPEGRLAELDRYEGVPELYARRAVELEGGQAGVQSYIYRAKIPPGAPDLEEWPGPAADRSAEDSR